MLKRWGVVRFTATVWSNVDVNEKRLIMPSCSTLALGTVVVLTAYFQAKSK